MLREDEKLKHIDTTPFTNVTPEMEEEMVKFAKQILPVVDELIHDLEQMEE